MLKLLKRMRKREVLMCFFCAAMVLGQIYFDLKLPDYMSELTVLIQTPGSEMSAIWSPGLPKKEIGNPDFLHSRQTTAKKEEANECNCKNRCASRSQKHLFHHFFF